MPAIIRRDGEGDHPAGIFWSFKLSAANSAGALDFMVGDVEPFSGPPIHVHDVQHDSFYVLDGTLTVYADGEISELRAGDFVSFPPGVAHTFDNLAVDGGRVTVINVMTPGGLGTAFEALAEAERSGLGADDRRAVARRHGITPVGPTLAEITGQHPPA